MPKRPMNSYSLKANDSIYPIEEGNVLKLIKPYKKKNRKIGVVVEHDAYLWIMKILKGRTKLQPKDRPILITRLLVPRIKDLKDKFIIDKNQVQKETVVKYLHNYGYDVHADRVFYNYRKQDYYSFYIATGLISIGFSK